MNEFHNAPTEFYFTSPLNSSVLPTLRVSGDGVLREFGFRLDRAHADVGMVILIGKRTSFISLFGIKLWNMRLCITWTAMACLLVMMCCALHAGAVFAGITYMLLEWSGKVEGRRLWDTLRGLVSYQRSSSATQG